MEPAFPLQEAKVKTANKAQKQCKTGEKTVCFFIALL
jgi:hypothetical protein